MGAGRGMPFGSDATRKAICIYERQSAEAVAPVWRLRVRYVEAVSSTATITPEDSTPDWNTEG